MCPSVLALQPDTKQHNTVGWLQDASDILLVSLELTKKLPSLMSCVDFDAIYGFLLGMTALLQALDRQQEFQQVLACLTCNDQA